MNNINSIIKENRLKNGWTQEELAKKLDVSVSLIRMYENGGRNPSDKIKEVLCNLFSISMNELYAKNDIEVLQQKLNEQISTKKINDKDIQYIKKQLVDLACNFDNIYNYISFRIHFHNKNEDYVIENVISNEFRIIGNFFFKQISESLREFLNPYFRDGIDKVDTLSEKNRFCYLTEEEKKDLKIKLEEKYKNEIEEIFDKIKKCINQMKKVDIPSYMIPLIHKEEIDRIYLEFNYKTILEYSNDLLEMPVSIEPNMYYAIKPDDYTYIIKLDNTIIDNQIFLIDDGERIKLYKIFNADKSLIIQTIDSNIPKLVDKNEITIFGRVVAKISNI